MDDLLAEFLTETNESLAELDTALLRLEQAPGDKETLGFVFRVVHTIKGTCGFLGLPRLERLTHASEEVLGRLREGTLRADPAVITTVLRSIDQVRVIVASLEGTGAEPAGDDAELIAALLAISEGSGAVPEPSATDEAVAAAPAPVQAGPSPAAPDAPATAAAVTLPTPRADQPAAADTGDAPAAAAAPTIRVGVDVLESLMALVTELVLVRNELSQVARTRDDPGLALPLQRLSHITSDLQEGVMRTRMQPIGGAWSKLPRLVRDLARDLGKRIELVMEGEGTELDRQVLELVRDPLTHMVRNSADHGLEGPEERRAAGKPETGRIRLNAFHQGGYVVVTVSDDGRGLDVPRIRAKALSRGFATEAELAAMPDAQVQRFIFRPGFSTAAAVTSVSGRGVGMDVVKTNIERIGGTIDLLSRAGEGTYFTVRIPLTLAIVSALVVSAGGERFAIPQTSVLELVRAETAKGVGQDEGPSGDGAAGVRPAPATRIEYLDQVPVLRLRGRLLPLVRLDRLLRLGTPESGGPATILVVSVGARTLGIIVDQVFDAEEIVVKPVAPVLRHVTMFGGTTILGDGSVIMILDPGGIARAAGLDGAEGAEGDLAAKAAEANQADAPDQKPVAMLVFEAGGGPPRAVPLDRVARLEDLPAERVEGRPGQRVVQYRGGLMALVTLDGGDLPSRAAHPVLVLAHDGRTVGLVVDRIMDVVEDRLRIDRHGAQAGVLGTAVISGKATDVLDVASILALAGLGAGMGAVGAVPATPWDASPAGGHPHERDGSVAAMLAMGAGAWPGTGVGGTP